MLDECAAQIASANKRHGMKSFIPLKLKTLLLASKFRDFLEEQVPQLQTANSENMFMVCCKS